MSPPRPTADDLLELHLEFLHGDDQPFGGGGSGARGYLLRHGEGRYRAANLSWDDELSALMRAVARRAAGESRARVGERLRRFVDAVGWERLEAELVEALAAGRGVRLDFLSNAPELYALPWELLPVGASGQALGELPGTLLRYRWVGSRTAPLLPGQEDWRREGRALLAWAGAGVPSEAQIEAARESLGERLEVLSDVTRRSLDGALRDAEEAGTPFSSLQLLCHGQSRAEGQQLLLEDGPIDPEELRALLGPWVRSLRLVVLSACAGGGVPDAGSRLGDHARALHRGVEAHGGVQAVIASRLLLSAPGSVEMTRALYRALGESRSVDQAFLAARDGLLGRARRGADAEHVTLQLLSRGDEVPGAPDGDGLLHVRLAAARLRMELTARGERWRVEAPLDLPPALLRAAAVVEDPWLMPFLGDALGAALVPGGAEELLAAAAAWREAHGASLRLFVEAEGPWAALPWERARLPLSHGAPPVSVRRRAP